MVSDVITDDNSDNNDLAEKEQVAKDISRAADKDDLEEKEQVICHLKIELGIKHSFK